MKFNIFSYLCVGLGAIAMASCSDDNGCNPTLTTPTEFVLNTPVTSANNVDLQKSSTYELVYSQPANYTDKSAPINVTYEVHLSVTGEFNHIYVLDEEGNAPDNADYIVLDEKYSTCVASIPASSIDKALVQLTGWKSASDVPADMTVYFRVYAYIAEGASVHNPIASNVVKQQVVPYYIELSDAAPIMWYLVGNHIADGKWSNDPSVSSVPLFLQYGYSYDKKTGAGEIVYLNYFDTEGWKIQPSSWNWDYGFMSDGNANGIEYRNGGGDNGNIWVGEEGYYLLTVNTGNNSATLVKQDIDPKDYGTICLAGHFNEWGDTEMTPASSGPNNHVWTYVMTYTEDDVNAGNNQFKFKISGSWDTNWGYGDNDGDINYYGAATGGGKNLGLPAGTWVIVFNDINGTFSIIAK